MEKHRRELAAVVVIACSVLMSNAKIKLYNDYEYKT